MSDERTRPETSPAGEPAWSALGTLALLTDARVLEAVRTVRTGERFGLNAPLDWPDPPLFGRPAVVHTRQRTPMGNYDDLLDSFNPQGGSQWDALGHIVGPEGLYGGRSVDELGIEHWAARGVVGRGVLLDVARTRIHDGAPIDWRESTPITAADLEECRKAQGVDPRLGDILLIRTGWGAGYSAADASVRAELAHGPLRSPGLASGADMVAYLREWGVAAVAADNPAVEVLPSPPVGKLHHDLIPRGGTPLGEMWWLEALADACATDGRYDFLLASAPLHLVGGVGSTANALAIR